MKDIAFYLMTVLAYAIIILLLLLPIYFRVHTELMYILVLALFIRTAQNDFE